MRDRYQIGLRWGRDRHEPRADRVHHVAIGLDDDGSAPVVFEAVHQGTPPPANPWAVWCDGEPRAMAVADSYVVIYLLWEIGRLLFDRTGEREKLIDALSARTRFVNVG